MQTLPPLVQTLRDARVCVVERVELFRDADGVQEGLHLGQEASQKRQGETLVVSLRRSVRRFSCSTRCFRQYRIVY